MVEEKIGEEVYLDEYMEYTKEGLTSLFKDLQDRLEKAESKGYTGVFVQFRSTLEPYEDCTCGPVEVQVRGYRPLNPRELEQEKEQKAIETLAKELGVTFYEANLINNLRSRGKI